MSVQVCVQLLIGDESRPTESFLIPAQSPSPSLEYQYHSKSRIQGSGIVCSRQRFNPEFSDRFLIPDGYLALRLSFFIRMKFVVTEWSLWFKDEVYGSRMEFLLQAGVYGLRIKFRVLG